jgi:two-component system, sensor histidine kinase PdtaS
LKKIIALNIAVLFISVLGFCQEVDKEKESAFYFYHKKAKLYQTINLDSADLYTDSCLNLARDMDSDYYLGKALQLKTRTEFYSSNLDSAIVYGNQSLAILKNYPDSIEYFLAEYNQGNFYLSMDDHIQALVQFKKAAKIVDDNFEMYVLVDRDMVNVNQAYCHASIGIVLDDLEDYAGALKSYHKALKITYRVENMESVMLRSTVLNNIGLVYVSLGDYEAAESYAIASMEQKKILGQESSIGFCYQVMAKAAFGRAKFDLAIKFLEQSDKKFQILLNQDEIDRNKFLRAKSYLAIGKYQKSLEILMLIEEVYLSRFSKSEQAEYYEVLASTYQKMNDLEMANDYLRITLKIRKEIDVKNDKKIVHEFVDFIENEEVELNEKIQNLKTRQDKEKLELQIAGDKDKEIWIYTLFLVSILCLVLIIMVIANAYRKNRKTTRDLSVTIEEKKILFKEVHHRVKNNFQIISSLLNLQHGIEEDEYGKKVLTDAQGRIQSMSLVHEMLYRKNEVKSIDFRSYAEELVASIFKSLTDVSDRLKYTIHCDTESFDLEVAVPIGLIMNEAITNSVKYAFNDSEKGQIDIILNEKEAGKFHLMIKDDGVGIKEEFIKGKVETLGIELINILSGQLGGELSIKNQNGTSVEINFSV